MLAENRAGNQARTMANLCVQKQIKQSNNEWHCNPINHSTTNQTRRDKKSENQPRKQLTNRPTNNLKK
jgi:hypothetical protein